MKEEIELILGQMTAKQREVWTLFLEGLDIQQIADRKRLSPQAVKGHLDGGKERARRRLGSMKELLADAAKCLTK